MNMQLFPWTHLIKLQQLLLLLKSIRPKIQRLHHVHHHLHYLVGIFHTHKSKCNTIHMHRMCIICCFITFCYSRTKAWISTSTTSWLQVWWVHFGGPTRCTHCFYHSCISFNFGICVHTTEAESSQGAGQEAHAPGTFISLSNTLPYRAVPCRTVPCRAVLCLSYTLTHHV